MSIDTVLAPGAVLEPDVDEAEHDGAAASQVNLRALAIAAVAGIGVTVSAALSLALFVH